MNQRPPCTPSFADMLVSSGCPQCGHILGVHTKDKVCSACAIDDLVTQYERELQRLQRLVRKVRA